MSYHLRHEGFLQTSLESWSILTLQMMYSIFQCCDAQVSASWWGCQQLLRKSYILCRWSAALMTMSCAWEETICSCTATRQIFNSCNNWSIDPCNLAREYMIDLKQLINFQKYRSRENTRKFTAHKRILFSRNVITVNQTSCMLKCNTEERKLEKAGESWRKRSAGWRSIAKQLSFPCRSFLSSIASYFLHHYYQSYFHLFTLFPLPFNLDHVITLSYQRTWEDS